MAITALPTPPSRANSPATFASSADSFIAALPQFVTEANALQTDVNSKQTTASSAATTATTKASEAAASAASAASSESAAAASSSSAASSASSASTSAATATTKASEASASATSAASSAAAAAASIASIAGGPVASVNGRTGVVTGVQDTLVSGANIKTVNGNSLLGSGDLQLAGVPVGALIPIHSNTLPNTLSSAGSTYMKSGVVAAASAYPSAPSGPYLAQSVAPAIDLTGRHPAYGATKYVIPTSGGVAVSTDTISWSVVSLTGVSSFSACAYLNGRFIVFQSGGDKCYESTDAVTWTQRTLPFSATWYNVAWSGTRYVAVCGNTGTADTLIYSTDLTTWTTVNVGMTSYDVAYGGGKFVVVGTNGTAGSVRYSTDGVTWNTAGSVPTQSPSFTWRFVVWNGTKFLSSSFNQYDSGYSAYKIWGMTSTDGSSWSLTNMPQQATNSACEGLAVVGTTFYAAAHLNSWSNYATAIGWTSADGSTWNQMSGPGRQYSTPFPCCMSRGKIAVNGSTLLWGGGLISKDSGTNWGGIDLKSAVEQSSASVAEVSYGASLYVAAVYYPYSATYANPVAFVGVSNDGVRFSARSVGVQDVWQSAAFFNAKHFISGRAYLLYSSNGDTWYNVGMSGGVLRVAGSRIFCFRDSYIDDPNTPSTTTTYQSSTDGTSWTSYNHPCSSPYVAAYGGGKYMMLAGNGQTYPYAYTSNDGISSWSQVGAFPTGHSGDSRGLVYAFGAFIRFGKDGKISTSTDLGVTWNAVTTINGSLSDCDWATSDGTTIVAGSKNSSDFVVSKDGVNFFVRKAPLKQLNKWGTLVNTKLLSSAYYPFGALDQSEDYVLNDRAQFAAESLTKLGTQLYMRVS